MNCRQGFYNLCRQENHTLKESGAAIPLVSHASLHALCPFGGVVSIYQYLMSGTFVRQTQESSFILMWIVIILSVAMGAVFCGWVCPFGSIQEFTGKIGKKIFKKRYNKFLPAVIDKYLRYLRYLVLIWVIYMTASVGTLIFKKWDPYHALFNIWSDEVAAGGIIVLGIVLLLSLFIERPWCKYVCPYGAFLGIFNTFRIFKIKRNENTCINCGKCDSACPMNIDVSKTRNVTDHQCISCMKCTSEAECPVKDTVSMKIKPIAVGIIILTVIFGGVAASSAFNLWNTGAKRNPARIKSGKYEGLYNPSDIRGSYTFNDISSSFDISVEVLALPNKKYGNDIPGKNETDIFLGVQG